jgi:hypothetical protein
MMAAIVAALEAGGSFAWRHWKLIAGGLVVASLLIYSGIKTLDARHWQKQDELHVAQRDTEIAKNAVNLTSIGTLQGIIAEKNKESDIRAKAFTDAKDANARTIADLDKRYGSTAARVAALTAISRVGGGEGPCRVPAAVASALEGL